MNTSMDDKEIKEKILSVGQQLTIALYQNIQNTSNQYLYSITEYARLAIRGAFILNGSAGIAILASLDKFPEKGKSYLILCAIGASAAVLSAGLSYFAQKFYAECEEEKNTHHLEVLIDEYISFLKNTKGSVEEKEIDYTKADNANFFACLSWSISIICFLNVVCNML